MAPQLSIIKGLTRKIPPVPMHKVFEDVVENNAHKTALIQWLSDDREFTLSYGKLNAQANQLANAILQEISRATANSDGDWVVAVSMKPSIDFIMVILAVLKTGAAYMSIGPSAKIELIEHICHEVRPVLTILDTDHPLPVLYSMGLTLKFNSLKRASLKFSADNLKASFVTKKRLENLAAIIFTSGSTGIPRGVRLAHSNIMNRLKWQWHRFPYSLSEEIAIFKTPLVFIDSVAEIWGPLLSGLSLVIVPRGVVQDAGKFIGILEKFRIERVVLVPSLLRSMFQYLATHKREKTLEKLRLVISSGELLPIHLAREFYEHFSESKHKLCNFYGSAETAGDITYYVCGGKKKVGALERIPIGRPIFNTVVYLLDPYFKPVTNNFKGNIFVSGKSVCLGYVNKRDDDRFVSNYLASDLDYATLFKTGDYGNYRSDLIHYDGRIEGQIKVRGRRVELTDIETQAMLIEGVDEVHAICYHPGERDQEVLAFVRMLAAKRSISAIKIEEMLKDRLPEYALPQVIIVNSFPYLINGKVDRQTMINLYENFEYRNNILKISYNGVETTNLITAKNLFETVKNVLGKSLQGDKLTPQSNFFELGGTSMKCMEAVADLKRKGYYIDICTFLAAKDLGEIAVKLFNYQDPASLSSRMKQTNKAELQNEYVSREINEDDFDDVISLIADTFFEKGRIEGLLKPALTQNALCDVLKKMWPDILEHKLSFVVHNQNFRKIIGVSINFDARRETPIDYGDNVLKIIAEFRESIQESVLENLPKKLNQVMHAYLMATFKDLPVQENIAVTIFMMNEVEKLAKLKKFCRIYMLSTSELTQQLAYDLGYTIIRDVHINEFVQRNGDAPFMEAPDGIRAVAAVKYLN